ncbi:MAG: valine--tRNA ligase [Myxococcales bacterium]|nr:valine--tRNA ligase [Myxococcales bacterium]
MSEDASETELEKAYDPRTVESRWYPRWLEMGVFHAADKSDKPAFCISIPPPNVTGSLHCGHALYTIQDIYTRQARMAGCNALWLPGTDHAGIATQVVVERLLKREGTDRHALGRAKFLERVWQWKAESGGRIDNQFKVLGFSLDWERYRFTMDPQMSRAVREAFVRLYEEGLIYRAERLINWSVGSQTVLSDLEVESEEEDGEIFEFAYKIAGSEEEIVVATTRPETMLGDTAVAVHPDDERYKHLLGKELVHPFVDRRFPVIADGILVDPKFGTGAVKVTPAHDFNDFATGKRHDLPMVSIMNKDGTLNANAGEFVGMERFAARKAVKKRLDELGLARGTKRHRLAVPRCQRTHTVVEPMLSEQWYVKTEPLAKPAIEAVQTGKTVIVPEEWTKTYMHWMTNIQDWCISRQLWWGHQIPAWYCKACSKTTVSRDDVSVCAHCGSKEVEQDQDVLDTWFSSGLWPFATLGWPDKTEALATFYPTTIMETGFDILFFWVARMMMMGIHFVGDVPFKKVLLHGMVTDEKGDKMSKVKGNVIDPLDVVYGIELEKLVEKNRDGGATEAALKNVRNTFPQGIPAYGADALRWTLATYPPQQRKIPLSIKRVEGGRFLCNKLWNAVRFALPSITGAALDVAPASLADRWILSRLSATAAAVWKALDEFRLDEATTALYRFFWNELCDWYLELVKPVLAGPDGPAKAAAKATLARAIEGTLRLMHPIIPFVTEELWQKVPRAADAPASVSLAAFPKAEDYPSDPGAEREMAALQAAISAVRSIRSEHEVHPGASVHVRLVAGEAVLGLLEAQAEAVRTLAKVEPLEILASGAERPSGFATSSAGEIEVQVLLKGLVDSAHEAARIERELKRLDKDLTAMRKQLSQPNFTDKAPPEVVAEARARLVELETARGRLEAGRGLVAELAAG